MCFLMSLILGQPDYGIKLFLDCCHAFLFLVSHLSLLLQMSNNSTHPVDVTANDLPNLELRH